jgi:hypothetical protein
LEEERKVTFFDRSFDSIAMGKKFPFLHWWMNEKTTHGQIV